MKLYSLLIGVLLIPASILAQPLNDECINATPLGPLPLPAACPNGLGQTVTVNGTNINATPSNPYPYLTNCNPSAGGTSTSIAANDVWFSFVATGYNITVDITSTFNTPNVAVWQGSCGNLTGRGCGTGTGGFVSVFIDQFVPGDTYYIQVSGFDTEQGNFTMSVHNNINCDNCMLLSSLTTSPQPVNGMYQPGQQVQFCYHVDQYAEVNTNWLHGVQIDFGPGWDQSTLSTVPSTSYDGLGVWAWYPAGITDLQGQFWEAGFYYDRFGDPLGGGTPSDGNPGNNFGDHNPTNITLDQNPYIIPSDVWNFCWTISVNDVCVPGVSLGITINTSGDGESGNWANNGCNSDPVYVFQAVSSCCPPNVSTISPGCGAATGSATVTPVGNVSPYTYQWYNSSNTLIQTDANVNGAQNITNLAPGNYTVHLTDANLCLQVVQFTIDNGGNAPAPLLSSNAPICEGQNLLLDASIIPNAQYFWSGPNGFSSNTQDPTINGVQINQQGIYSCYVVVGNCTSTTVTINVVITPGPSSTFNVGPPVCVGNPITISYTGNAPAGSTFDWNFSGGTIQSGSGQGPYSILWSAPGVYNVTLSTSLNGCTSTSNGTAIVEPNPIPGFTVSPQVITMDNPNIQVTDQSTGAATWQYIISDGGNYTAPSFVHGFDEVGVYYITQIVTNNIGCSAQITQDITVQPVSIVWVPNAFTPGNNDNLNDSWGAVTTNITEFELKIFDRWGQIVFTSQDPEYKWNGTWQNKHSTYVKQDVYVYKIWYTDARGNDLTQTGRVTVVR